MSALGLMTDHAAITLTATKISDWGSAVRDETASQEVSSPCLISWSSSAEQFTEGMEQSARRAEVLLPLVVGGSALTITPNVKMRLRQGGSSGTDLGVWRVVDTGSRDHAFAQCQKAVCERWSADA